MKTGVFGPDMVHLVKFWGTLKIKKFFNQVEFFLFSMFYTYWNGYHFTCRWIFKMEHSQADDPSHFFSSSDTGFTAADFFQLPYE